MTLPSRFPTTLLTAALLAFLVFLAPVPARADVGIEKVSPSSGAPGDPVVLTLGCGFCYPPCHGSPGHRKPSPCMLGTRARPPAAFPISLVPIEKTPKPRRCGPNMICSPEAPEPPHRSPFTFLGLAMPVKDSDGSPRHVPRYRLHFRIPDLRPGRYALVIYCGSCLRGKGGSLIASPQWQLRVRPLSGRGAGALRPQ